MSDPEPFELEGWTLRGPGDVIYLATASTAPVRAAMTAGVLGCMATPGNRLRIEDPWIWAADNDRFAGGTDWRASTWLRWLEKHVDAADRCLFAAVPDRLADPIETTRLWRIWRPAVVELGYRPAYVLQDGATGLDVDLYELAELDGTLFIGGTTDYKRGPDAQTWAARARQLGVWVHWGRVNSRRRFAMAALDGDSADGTFLRYGPTRNLDRLVAWTNTLDYREGTSD